MWLTITLIILSAIVTLVGAALILDWWLPFKNEHGEKVPLSPKEKSGVGVIVLGVVVSLLSLIFVSNPPWLSQLREKMKLNKA